MVGLVSTSGSTRIVSLSLISCVSVLRLKGLLGNCKKYQQRRTAAIFIKKKSPLPSEQKASVVLLFYTVIASLQVIELNR